MPEAVSLAEAESEPVPRKRGRKSKASQAVAEVPSSALASEVAAPSVQEVAAPFVQEVAAPTLLEVQEPVVAVQPVAPKARGRPKRTLDVVTAPREEVKVTSDVIAQEPDVQVASAQVTLPQVAPVQDSQPQPEMQVRRRGRPKNPEQAAKPAQESKQTKGRGRKKIVEPDPEPTTSQPEQPAAHAAPKTLVRVRREAKEHVFSYQAALYNPYLALLEEIRSTPGGVVVRELPNELDDWLLERLGGRKGLESVLAELERGGWVFAPKKGTVQASREIVPIVGRLEIRVDGSGWLTPDTPSLRPMLIPVGKLLFAWHGDRVVVRELQRVPQSIGEVIRILERARSTVTGTLEYKRGYAMLRPDEAALPSMALESATGAVGTRLVAKPLYPEDTGEDEAIAVVQDILGDAGSLESERAAVITRFGLPTEFPKAALEQAGKLGQVTAKDQKGRIDLRGKRVFALPSLEAGLQIEPLGNGNILLAVHYADSGYWIDEATPLEQAILERGAAVNLAGEGLPLLPPTLLSQLQFSAGAERLSLSVLIETTAKGDLVNYVVRPSVVSAMGVTADASKLEQDLLVQIGGLEAALGLARRLCATAIAASDVTALYRVPGVTSPELSPALERSSGFDPDSLAIATLKRYLTKPERIEAIHSTAATEGLSLESPLSKAVDFLNVRILGWCATKLSQRKRENLAQQLPNLALPLKRLEQRALEAERSLLLFSQIAALTQTYPMRGVVVAISEFALEIVLENGAIGTLALEDLGEEVSYTPNQWKTRLGRVFRPGSIVRVQLVQTRPATREATLWLHQKESAMSRLRRRKPGASTAGNKPRVGQTIQKRGVVVLGSRPRAEYPRPVRITARKLYFGEWSREHFAQLEGENPEFDVQRPSRSNPSNNYARPQVKHEPRGQESRNHQARGQAARDGRRDSQGSGLRDSQGSARRDAQAKPRHPQHQNPRHIQAAPDVSRPSDSEQARASRIEALRQRQLQALERNANRASAAPAPVGTAPVVAAPIAASESADARRSRRRPNQRRTQEAA